MTGQATGSGPSGVVIRYIYDANGNLLAEADTNNVITRYYVHGAGLLAAITPADDLYCYHFDATGNTVAITDGSEAVVNSYDYSPFGMILSESEGFAQPFKYVGKLGVTSESNGFYYMRARYYDPVVGRFISEDPMGFDGGDVNLYVYGSNNPLLLVDPWGLTWQQDVEFVARGVGVIVLEAHKKAFLSVVQTAAISFALGKISTVAQLSHTQAAVLDNSLKAGDILNRAGGTGGRDFARRIDSKIQAIREDVYGSASSPATSIQSVYSGQSGK